MSQTVLVIAYNYVENMISCGKIMTVQVQKNLHCVNFQRIENYGISLLFDGSYCVAKNIILITSTYLYFQIGFVL